MKDHTFLYIYPKQNTLKQRWTVALYSILGWNYNYTVSREIVLDMLKDIGSK